VLPAWQEPRPLADDARADVCVIGLGGSGLRAVLELTQAGLDVIGIDAGKVAGGAAGRNGGLLLAGTAAFHHHAREELGRAEAAHWYRATMSEVEHMLGETPAHVRRTGSLRIAADAAELADCRLQFEAMQEDGLPVEMYEGPEGEGLLFPGDAVTNPLGRCRQLADLALAAGARLHGATEAVRLGQGSLSTTRGRIEARAIVVAVDGGLARLLPELAEDVRPLRLQMLATAPAAEVNVPRPVYRRDGFEYWQQLPDGRVLLGGFRDKGGEAEWSAPAVPGGPVQELLERFLREHLGITARVTHRWAALVGYRSRLLPVMGEVRPGVFALGGYNGTGNVIGSLAARHVASLVSAAV